MECHFSILIGILILLQVSYCIIAKNLKLSLKFFCYRGPTITFCKGLFNSSLNLSCKSHVVCICAIL